MKKTLIVLVIGLFALSSCRTTGYGCKGRESWNGMIKRINRGY